MDGRKAVSQSPSVFSKVANVVTGIIGIILIVVFSVVLVVGGTITVKGMMGDKNPTFFGYMAYTVLSDSMTPGICRGDLVVCHEEDAADIQVGDIIAFDDPASSDGAIVLHRVVKDGTGYEGREFTTKGDANDEADVWPVKESAVHGVMVGQLQNGGQIVLALKDPSSLMILVGLVVLIIALNVWVARARAQKKSESAKHKKG